MTLIELMVVLAITALLVTLAAPSFVRMIQSNAVSGSVNTFLGDLRFARSEAIRRGGNVVMCRSDTPEATAPTCGTGAGAGNAGWSTGWIVFLEQGTNDNFDSGTDTLLRVQSATKSVDAITDNPSSTKFKFTATGRLQASGNTAALTFGGTAFASSTKRTVCVSLGGRGRVAGDGNTSCGGSNE